MASLALLVAIVSTLLVAQPSSGRLRQGDAQGYFGTVSAITPDRPSVGETRISLDTPTGVVELAATATTEVHIPGRESASVASLLVGDSVAVLANGEQAQPSFLRFMHQRQPSSLVDICRIFLVQTDARHAIAECST